MAKIPRELKDLLTEPHNIWVATTGSDGMPNVSIKSSGALLDDEHLYFADMFSRKTRENLEHDPRVAVGIHDPERKVAMQVKGTAELIDKALSSSASPLGWPTSTPPCRR
jgi:Predicted flavin-nucleotide-binding protein structurally related to pyridoxine 5''-phosphate oxidase